LVLISKIVMHEISIALSLLDLVEKQCREAGYQAIDSVRIKVGKAAGILPEAFSFALDVAKKETLARDAKFVIDWIPLGGVCNGCGDEFEMEESYVLACPKCASPSFRINKGYELEVVEMELN
jgi:hydrogenase nickel incorporation protein HypA/HybF